MELKTNSRYLLFDAGNEEQLQEIEIRKFSPSKQFIKITLSNNWKDGMPIVVWRSTKEVLGSITEEIEGEIPIDLSKEIESKYSGIDIDNLICPECFEVKKNCNVKQKEYILVKCDKCNYLMGLVSRE